jgi:B9 domain-containing protein 2
MVTKQILRPRVILKVWRFNDSSSTNDLLAYGVAYLPKTSGFHEIACDMWTPYGDWKFGALSFYMDSTPRLNNLRILGKDI